MTFDYRDRVYEKYASHFKRSSAQFDEAQARRWAVPYARFIEGWFPSDRQAAILDLGCGNGQLLHLFKEKGYCNLYGVDISAEQVALARQVVPGVEEGNVLTYLDSHVGQFDLISVIDVVEHLTKSELLTFLEQCLRGLKPGGRVIIQTPNGFSPWCTAIRFGDFTHEFCYTPSLLGQLLGLCGFVRYEAREQGPVPYGWMSTVRWAIWQLIKLKLKIWNMAETGSSGGGIYTRVFISSAVKPTAGT